MATAWPGRAIRAAIAILLLLPAVAGAQEEAVRIAGGGATLAGKTVPLPGQGWRVLGEGTTGEGEDRMAVAVLGRSGPGGLEALAILRANTAARRAVYPLAQDCTRTDTYFATIRYDTPSDGYCQFGNLVLPDGSAAEGAWGAAVALLAREGTALPPAFVMVGAQARNTAHAVDLRLYLPRPAGGDASWAAHPLSPSGRGGAAQAEALALEAYAALLQPALERGLRGLPPLQPLPIPEDTAAVANWRQAQVQALLGQAEASGPIGQAERTAALRAASEVPERQDMPLFRRTFWKVVSYRIASTADTLLVSWAITGSATQTLGFAAANAVIKPFVAYANELAWASSGIGRPRASLVPVTLGEIGIDRAQ